MSLLNATLTSITGKTYLVTAEDDKGWTLTRPDTGSEVRVTAKLVERTRTRLVDGQAVLKQRAEKHGGISYTVAIEAGVLAVLASTGTPVTYDPTERVFNYTPNRANQGS